jgi:hypothetical protein
MPVSGASGAPKRRRKVKAVPDSMVVTSAPGSDSLYVCPICGCYRPNLIKDCRVPSCPKGKVAPAPIVLSSDNIDYRIGARFRPRVVWMSGFFTGVVASAGGFILYLFWVQP